MRLGRNVVCVCVLPADLLSPGSDWSDNELLAFNIRVIDTGVAAFFNTPELSPSTVSAKILTNIDRPDGPAIKDDHLVFFQYMKMVENPRSSESRFDDFLLHSFCMSQTMMTKIALSAKGQRFPFP